MNKPRPDVGPNGSQVDRFVEAVDRLTDAQVLELAGWANPDAESQRVLESVRRVAAEKAEQAGRADAVGWARDLMAERATRMADSPFDSDLVWASGTIHAVAAERREAFPVLLDALVAVITRDLLTSDEFETLAGPWLDAQGVPPPSRNPDRSGG
jgi:hypothetical protein